MEQEQPLFCESGNPENPYQSIDDDYLLLLHEKLKNAKEQRKKCEQDNELLEGRVNCLKNEEEKTLKKIEATQKKTREKLLDIEKHKQPRPEKERVFRQSKIFKLQTGYPVPESLNLHLRFLQQHRGNRHRHRIKTSECDKHPIDAVIHEPAQLEHRYRMHRPPMNPVEKNC